MIEDVDGEFLYIKYIFIQVAHGVVIDDVDVAFL